MKGSKLFVLVIFSATFQYCASDAITTTSSTPPLHNKKKTEAISPNPFGSSTLFPVEGSIQEGYYYTNLSIGKSQKSYSVDIDTGSELTWVICDAYPPPSLKSQEGQSHHDPYKLSREVISCDDPLCNYVKHPRDDPCRLLSNDNPCTYQIDYGDGSSSTGTLVRDYFHILFTNGSILRSSLIFGCGTYHPPESDPNKKLFGDGVLGLANGKLSIVRQLREKGLMLNKIGHCFNSKKDQQGYLFFGDYLDPSSSSSIKWTPMVTLSKDNNHYSPGSADLLFDNKPTSVKNLDVVFGFILLGMAFDSPEAQQLNKDIFETIYYHALKASSELAAKEGPYETYSGSPVSKGILQPDMWGVTPSSRWDWGALRDMIANNGVRNSLLVAPMPTASTSQILGNNECFEPYTSNIYSRRVLSGEFVVVNKHLLHDLTEMGLWSPALKNQIIYEDGSVQKIPEIPDELKVIYKTVWEIKQKTLVDMAVDRGCYIDQSQSLNIHMDQPNFGKLTSLHFHAWSKGLKTGMYYLRSRAAADAIKFTVDTSILNEKPKIEDDENSKMSQMVCSLTNREECMACGS